ncbi:unnamed protein product [Miscanthus lutarioriparius]|uniref:F-box domain-containing protein n=1 Tax=Miscanthus lutarioriparius TaxID=422564 RepID=A0A811NF35_9POAL|nr:unnamed protein product [Miscanthus lutarioriparius]
MAAPSSRDPAALMDELVEECLLRLPPEDHADLARAALVSKQWHRVVTGAIFRRRYIEFHRSAPLLGYMLNQDNNSIRFVPTSSFRPPQVDRRDVRAIHSRHGRVLLLSAREREGDGLRLLVWDPTKDKQWELPVLQPGARIANWDAALACAVGNGCSHLDCHFKVIFVGRSGGRRFSCFYSSEADSWSDPIFVSEKGGYVAYGMYKSVLVGNAFYFKIGGSDGIFKLDLQTHQICRISRVSPPSLLIATEDGSMLGVAKIIINSTLCVWLREQGRWVESRLIQLRALLPDDALCDPLLPPQTNIDKPSVVAFSETGAGVIFLRTCVGYFTIDLNSGRSKKVGNAVLGSGHIVPYVSFCTPAPGTVSTDVGPGASGVVSTDDEPGAGVVVSRDEGLGDVVVSTDEGPGDVLVSTDEGPGPSMLSA